MFSEIEILGVWTAGSNFNLGSLPNRNSKLTHHYLSTNDKRCSNNGVGHHHAILSCDNLPLVLTGPLREPSAHHYPDDGHQQEMVTSFSHPAIPAALAAAGNEKALKNNAVSSGSHQSFHFRSIHV
jgi:hypothetical protein